MAWKSVVSRISHSISTQFEADYVSEIVLDLDPPSRSEFQLAVKAASILKLVLDKFNLTAFVKTSGNKGIQVYIPLQEETYSWEETRLFTTFIADFLVKYDPHSYTTERLKKNRAGRLYVDFIQHAEGKTIIAPYSVRNNEDGLVATPLFWEELNEDLTPDLFTMEKVLNRLDKYVDPFSTFFTCKKSQPFDQVLHIIKEGGSI